MRRHAASLLARGVRAASQVPASGRCLPPRRTATGATPPVCEPMDSLGIPQAQQRCRRIRTIKLDVLLWLA